MSEFGDLEIDPGCWQALSALGVMMMFAMAGLVLTPMEELSP